MSEPDLAELFRSIEKRASEAIERLQAGEAVNGSSALQKIRADASDGARWAREAERLESR